MDEIQRTLIKAGRKDLAQKYYVKITGRPYISKLPDEDSAPSSKTSKNPPHWDIKKGQKVKWNKVPGEVIQVVYPKKGKGNGPVKSIVIKFKDGGTLETKPGMDRYLKL